MFHVCTPFQVEVVKPLQKEGQKANLRKGDILTVRAIVEEHRLDGNYIILFLVWNAGLDRLMLEHAEQFKPVEL